MAKVGEFREEPYEADYCPRCLGPLPVGFPGALSRADNTTEVCSDCGTDEALRDFFAKGVGGSRANPAEDWPLAEVVRA